MFPGNLCTKLVHNFAVRPGLGEGPHVFEVARGVTGELRKFALQIGSEPIDHLRAPAFALLTGDDIAADLPVV